MVRETKVHQNRDEGNPFKRNILEVLKTLEKFRNSVVMRISVFCIRLFKIFERM